MRIARGWSTLSSTISTIGWHRPGASTAWHRGSVESAGRPAMESTRMDHTGFDTLSRSLATFGTRRALLRLLPALPLTGILATRLTEEGEAGGRHKRRKTRNRHRSGDDKDNRTGKRTGRGTAGQGQGQEAYAAVHSAQLSPGCLRQPPRWVWRDADLRLQHQSHPSGRDVPGVRCVRHWLRLRRRAGGGRCRRVGGHDHHLSRHLPQCQGAAGLCG